jgi:hypothetical protein
VASRSDDALAAGLLIASVVLSLVGLALQTNQFNWSVPYPYSSLVWSVVYLALVPVANIASLLLGDRRKFWVKLNYAVIMVGALLRALYWFADSVLRVG